MWSFHVINDVFVMHSKNEIFYWWRLCRTFQNVLKSHSGMLYKDVFKLNENFTFVTLSANTLRQTKYLKRWKQKTAMLLYCSLSIPQTRTLVPSISYCSVDFIEINQLLRLEDVFRTADRFGESWTHGTRDYCRKRDGFDLTRDIRL